MGECSAFTPVREFLWEVSHVHTPISEYSRPELWKPSFWCASILTAVFWYNSHCKQTQILKIGVRYCQIAFVKLCANMQYVEWYHIIHETMYWWYLQSSSYQDFFSNVSCLISCPKLNAGWHEFVFEDLRPGCSEYRE